MADSGDTPTVAQHSLQQLVDMADEIGLVSLDMDGRIRLWNSGAERLTGYHRNHVEGRPFHQLQVASTGETGYEPEELRKVTLAGIREINCTLKRSDGSLCTLFIKTARLSNDGKMCGYCLVMAEAAVTQPMESKQQNNEALLSELQEISRLGLYEVDPSTWTGHCSSTLCGIFGFANDEPFRDFNFFCEKHVHPDDLSRLLATREQLLKSGGTDEFEYRYRHPDGNDRILLVRRRVIHDGQGRACRLLGTVQDITGRRHAETRLLASETRYRTLLDHATDAFFIHSHGGVIVDANTRAIESLGYTREELIGQKPTKFALQLTSEKLRAISATLDADQVVTYESVHCQKNGSTFPVEVRIRPLWLEGQRFSITMIRDLTKQKQAEQALRDSEERFHLAMLGANDGLWDWNIKSDDVYYSPQWYAILGYQSSELPGTFGTWVSLLHPDDAVHSQAQMQNFLRSSLDKYEIEFRLRHKDGSYRTIQSRGFVTRENETPVRLVGTHRDLTERKLAELTLRRSEDFLRRAQQMANFGSWTFNLQTKMFSGSEECARIYGLSGLECSQQEWEKLLHPDDAARVFQAFLDTLQGVPFDQEYRLVIRGKTKWISVKGSIEADASGQPTHLIGVTQDVSARRRLEEQLRHSQKMDAFGQLAGGVAHDFNNLLTVINGFSEILLEETDEKDLRRHAIQQIREAGERAAVLTRQLLTLSRRQFTEPRVIGLNEIVSRSESLLRRLIGENITIATILEPGLPNIKADPGQIDQVLMNLVVNARDAMPNGGRVLVATRRRVVESAASDSLSAPSPGHYVELFVSDNGTGMSEETKARIYEPFFSTKGVGKGTGLGLATVYGIIQQNHGFIDVESFPSVGTTFRILWPVCELGQERTDQAASIIETVRGTETILLAEDEPLVRQLAVLSLKACGYDVIEADSGETALRLANSRQNTLPLLITDVVMPGISGTELARRLRQTYPNIRVLYMSGYTDDAVVRCGEFTAFDDFLQKPFTPMQLARKVQDLLSISEQAAGVS